MDSQHRRTFLKVTGASILSLSPLAHLLANKEDDENEDEIAEKIFANKKEDHYLGKNLANIYIYFVNVVRKRKKYIPEDYSKNSYVIFSIPNQHLNEPFYKRDTPNDNPDPHLSGFSFFSFRLWENVVQKGKKKLSVDLKSLMDWNADHFHFMTTRDIQKELFHFFDPNCTSPESVQKASIQESPSDPERNVSINDFKYYKQVLLGKLLQSATDDSYLSILELPAKLFITPHIRDAKEKTKWEWLTRFEMSRMEIREYHLKASRTTRTVQELWHARMYLTKVQEKGVDPNVAEVEYPPTFRILGFRGKITCSTSEPCKMECPEAAERFLPQLLDRAELTYLGQLANAKYESSDYDFKAESDITFSALGATAKLHYKSLKAQNPLIDLVEYEHHFSLGRDEYIKVARIGVIASTAQKALHVKIARRRFNDNNQSYMQYNEYVELVEKEKEYEKGYVVGNDPFPKNHFSFYWEPGTAGPDIIGDTKDPRFQTSFRRFPFRKIVITEEIKNKPIIACEIDKEICSDSSGNCPEIFWVLNEADKKDFTINGWYWDKNVKNTDIGKMEFAKPFSTPVLFIRKLVFVTCSGNPPVQVPITKDLFKKKIFDHFTKESNKERRRINLHAKPVAFTPKYDPDAEDEKSNSTNSPKAKFFEYYFDPKAWPTDSKKSPRDEDFFEEEYFPVYPQMKEAEIASDHAQEYTQQYLPLPIRYNNDYVAAAFADVDEVVGKPGHFVQIVDPTPVNNKGKLIFDVLEGKAYAAYDDSKAAVNNAFKGATDKIGGVAVPDPKVKAISLRDNALQLPQKINEYVNTKLVRILDILRGEDEILGGIKAKDIISEFVDLKDTPIFELEKQLKQVQEKIEDFTEDLRKQMDEWKNLFNQSTFIKEVMEKVKTIEEEVRKYKEEFQRVKEQLEQKFNTLKALKQSFQQEFKSYEALLNAYKNFFEVERLKAYTQLNGNADFYIDLVKKEMILIGYEIFVQYYDEWKTGDYVTNLRARVNNLANQNVKRDLLDVITLITTELPLKYDAAGRLTLDPDKLRMLENYLKDASKEIEFEGLKFLNRAALSLTGMSYESLVISIENTRLVLKRNNKEELNRLYTQLIGGALPADVEKQIKEYLVKSESLKEQFLHDFNKKSDVLLSNAIETVSQNLNTYKDDLVAHDLYNDILTIIELIDNVKKLSPYYYYERYYHLYRDYEDQFQKLQDLVKLFDTGTVLAKIKSDLEGGVRLLAADYQQKVNEYVRQYLANHTDIQGAFEVIKTIREEGLREVIKNRAKQEIKDRLEAIIKEEVGFTDLKEARRLAERAVTDFLKEQGGEYLKQIERAVKEVLEDLKEKVDVETFKEYALQALHFLETIKTPKTKNIAFRWRTENFRDKNLGILSFKRGNNPPTVLSVNVITTITYSLIKFPNVVDKISNSIDSRLANFGVGFLNILVIDFREVSFVGGTDQPTRFDVKIGEVRFEGALSFVQAFESFLKTLGEGFRLDLTPRHVGIGYTLPIPDIKTPSFNFFNLTLNFDFRIYFSRRPMTFTFSLARQESKFGLTAGILGGFGFFSITAEPKRGITEIEMALEFGAFLGISLGPIKGEVKLVAGLYYKKNDYEVVLEGYILCEGTLSVWILSVSARIYLGMISRNSSVEGVCTVTYSVKLGFIKRSFSGTYRKQIKGAQNQDQQAQPVATSFLQLMNQQYALSQVSLTAAEEKYVTQKFNSQEAQPYELADFNDFKTYYEAFIN